jgi:HK97 family phage portal protein
MGFFSRKAERLLAAEVEDLKSQIASIKNEMSPAEETFLKDFIVGGWSNQTSLSSDSAMRCSAVFACVRLLAGAIASAPVRIYKRGAGGARELIDKHPFSNMLGARPNEHITASTFWKVMATNKVLNGNAYAAIKRGSSGRPTSLMPLRASRVTPYQAWELSLDTKLGVSPYRLFYSVTWDNGTITVIDQDDMIHVPNIGWDGKQGISTIRAGAQALGLALSAEESASKIFENGMVSQLALTYPNKLSPAATEALRDHIQNRHGGSKNHHKPLILTEGGDVKTMSMNADDAQLLESRVFSVIDICRFFGVPPVMVGESTKTSSWGSGVEQMARWFVMFTLNDHLTDIEQEIGAKLFRNSDHFAEFDESELTRGDTKTRAEYFKAALGSAQQPGWMSQNEVRSAEGLPPDSGAKSNELSVPMQQPADGNKTDNEKQADGEDTDEEKPTDATVSE